MGKFDDKSNEEIQMHLMQLEQDYISIKAKLAKTWDEMVEMEKEAIEAVQTIKKRLNNNL